MNFDDVTLITKEPWSCANAVVTVRMIKSSFRRFWGDVFLCQAFGYPDTKRSFAKTGSGQMHRYGIRYRNLNKRRRDFFFFLGHYLTRNAYLPHRPEHLFGTSWSIPSYSAPACGAQLHTG